MPLFVVRDDLTPGADRPRAGETIARRFGPAAVVPVFTTRERAVEFARGAVENVAEIRDAAVVGWLTTLQRNGVEAILVDPEVVSGDRGRRRPVLRVARLLETLGGLARNWIADPPPPSRMSEDARTIDLFRCPTCGAVVERRAGSVRPSCCGRTMQPEGKDGSTVVAW